jgi:hypothetical protein
LNVSIAAADSAADQSTSDWNTMTTSPQVNLAAMDKSAKSAADAANATGDGTPAGGDDVSAQASDAYFAQAAVNEDFGDDG